MRTRTSTWFECKIRYDKMMEDGMQKKITELYVVDALSFTEAESSIIDEMSAYISRHLVDDRRLCLREAESVYNVELGNLFLHSILHHLVVTDLALKPC